MGGLEANQQSKVQVYECFGARAEKIVKKNDRKYI